MRRRQDENDNEMKTLARRTNSIPPGQRSFGEQRQRYLKLLRQLEHISCLSLPPPRKAAFTGFWCAAAAEDTDCGEGNSEHVGEAAVLQNSSLISLRRDQRSAYTSKPRIA